MLPRRRNRIAKSLLAAVLALGLAPPAKAAGWSGWQEVRQVFDDGLLFRVFGWLGLAPDAGGVLKCDQGSQIDPDGRCSTTSTQSTGTPPLAPDAGGVLKCDHGSMIDPDGRCSTTSSQPIGNPPMTETGGNE